MLTKQIVKETDTHTIVWRVDDVSDPDNVVPADVTGATVSFRVRLKGETGDGIVLAGSVKDGPAGTIQHSLTGTLEPGEYDVIAILTLAGDQTTAPTGAKLGTLLVTPTIPAP